MRRLIVEVDTETHDTIADLARSRGTTIENVIAGAMWELTINAHEPLTAAIAARHADGMTDAEIARALGMTNAQIVKPRREVLGLPANTKPMMSPRPRKVN